jgi:integrase
MLTVRAVEAAKPRESAYKLTDAHGLYLFVSPAGGKSWRANFAANGKQQTRTYGRWPAMTLGDARKAHQGARDGPQEATAPKFEAVAREWLRKTLPALSNAKHKIQVENTLERFAFKMIGKLPLDRITRAELVKVVQAVQDEGDRVETAHRVAGRIAAVFDYAQDAGYIQAHPASHLSRVLIARSVKKPMASIQPERAGELLRQIDAYPDLVTRLGLQLLAHTFVRVNELLGMQWGELAEDGAVWVVPASRVKGKGASKLPHVVPLSAQAQSVLAQLREINGDVALVLDSPANPGHPLSENTFLFALYRMGYKGVMTAHGFRALASTVLNEQSGFAHDVIERQLAHKESDAVRAAYNRAEYLPQRRKLMAWWSEWLQAAESQPAASE